MAQNSKIDPDPKIDPETSVEQLSPAWAASVVRIATVWGLGVGTAIALCLYAVLALHLGAGKFGIGLVLGFASGLMLAVGMAYQTYVQRHLRITFTSDLRGGALVSAFLGAAMLFVTATLFVMLSPPFLLGFALFLRNADHRALTWRQRRETYIGGLMPHVRAF